jgi:glycine oxidase
MKIAIVGAGIVGRLCAFELSQSNSVDHITIYDNGDHQATLSSAWVAAAMISPIGEALHSPEAIHTYGQSSLQRWPHIINQLNAFTQAPIFYNNTGSLVVAHQEDQSLLQQFQSNLAQLKYINQNDITHLNHNELLTKEPQINSSFKHSLWLQKEAFLDNRQLLETLYTYLSALPNISWHLHTSVNNVSSHSLHIGAEKKSFDLILDCTGSGSIQHSKNLRGVRGEVIWVRAPQVKFSHAIRLLHPRYKLYIAPHGENIYVIGATEIESHDSKPITVQSSLELLSALYSVSSGFSEAEIIGSHARIRPAYPNNLPQINYTDGLIHINGLYRHGYLLAPIIAHDVRCIIENDHHSSLWPNIINSKTNPQEL